MPAFCTHYLFCKEMQDLIGDTSFDLVPSAVAIGTQGPDLFFFSRFFPVIMPGKSHRRVGTAIHKCNPSELFDAFADYCAFSPNIDVAKSYIYGFIMHYALDRQCHPFVYSFQQRILDKHPNYHTSTAHNIIEHNMDTYILDLKLGIKDPSDFDCAKTLQSEYGVAEEIAHLLAFVIPRVTDKSVAEKDIIQTINDTIFMQKFLRNKNNGAMNLAKSVEALASPLLKGYKFSSNINPKDLEKSKKYGNINRTLWYSPYKPDEARYDSFMDLFDIAKDDCLQLINGFEQMCMGYSTGRDVTHNISFLTGIEV